MNDPRYPQTMHDDPSRVVTFDPTTVNDGNESAMNTSDALPDTRISGPTSGIAAAGGMSFLPPAAEPTTTDPSPPNTVATTSSTNTSPTNVADTTLGQDTTTATVSSLVPTRYCSRCRRTDHNVRTCPLPAPGRIQPPALVVQALERALARGALSSAQGVLTTAIVVDKEGELGFATRKLSEWDGRPQGRERQTKEKWRCKYCKEMGHTHRGCPVRKREEGGVLRGGGGSDAAERDEGNVEAVEDADEDGSGHSDSGSSEDVVTANCAQPKHRQPWNPYSLPSTGPNAQIPATDSTLNTEIPEPASEDAESEPVVTEPVRTRSRRLAASQIQACLRPTVSEATETRRSPRRLAAQAITSCPRPVAKEPTTTAAPAEEAVAHTRRCTRCRGIGHYACNCPERTTDEIDEANVPQIRRCGRCNQIGHNVRTCPHVLGQDHFNEEDEEEEDDGEDAQDKRYYKSDIAMDSDDSDDSGRDEDIDSDEDSWTSTSTDSSSEWNTQTDRTHCSWCGAVGHTFATCSAPAPAGGRVNRLEEGQCGGCGGFGCSGLLCGRLQSGEVGPEFSIIEL
ncbi:hypothetical protein EDC01DRAFT_750144 [Geopyxis carbonaria]|nr:hypothetical protein EDC01DRAFT_750144 [Geopyxis carbonaria]